MIELNNSKTFKPILFQGTMATENKVKMGVISGASLALKMKSETSASDSAILKEISLNMYEILGKIDKSI